MLAGASGGELCDPDHANLGQLKGNAAAIWSTRAEARRVVRDDLRAVFTDWVPVGGSQWARGLSGRDLTDACHRRIRLANPRRGHGRCADPSHTKACQREA
jgi:hypothetical protein